MAQDGSFQGHQSADASNNEQGSAPPASPGEHRNSGSLTDVPVAEDASRKVKKEVVDEPGSAGSSHSGAGQSKGNNKRSAEEVAAAIDETDDDDNNVSKAGKRKVAAPDAKGAGGGRRKKQLPHIITERERRKRMKGMFADLQALLPHVPEKTDKATIVGEAISFIRVLEGTVAKLEKRKQDLALERRAAAAVHFEAGGSSAAQGSLGLPQGWAWLPRQQLPKPAAAAPPIGFHTWSGTNVVLSVSNDDAFISVCAPRRAGMLMLVLSVLEKHRVDVVTAQVAPGDAGRSLFFSIHARVNAAAIQQLGGEPPASEDIYKLAVSEIMVWLSNYN